MDKFAFKNDNPEENVKKALKKFDSLEKKIDFLLNKLRKYEIENREIKLKINNLRKKNSILRENIRYSSKLIKEFLNKFNEFGI